MLLNSASSAQSVEVKEESIKSGYEEDMSLQSHQAVKWNNYHEMGVVPKTVEKRQCKVDM